MKKYGKKALALGLVMGMTISSLPVYGGTKPTLSAQSKTIAVGDNTTLTVQNKGKKAKYKWVSSNKKVATVTQKGKIKGKKAGMTTITCIVTQGKKKTQLKATIKVLTLKQAGNQTVTIGEKNQLVVNSYKGATYKWTSADKKIVTVNKNGVVTGKKVGTTKVRCTVKSKKKNYIAEYTVTVDANKTVATQTQLEQALANKKLTSITIDTAEEVELTIPEGNYGTIDLIVNAPNGEVKNYGVFKSITVKAIKPDTWHEYAKGNKITLEAKDSHFIVESTGSVEEISFTTQDAKVALEVHGIVKQMKVEAVTDLSLKGTNKEAIPVTMEQQAEGSKMDSDVPVQVTTPVKVDIVLQKGAEGSAVEVTKDVEVKVENQTEEKITVKTPVEEKEVGVGETITSNEEKKEEVKEPESNVVIGGGSTDNKKEETMTATELQEQLNQCEENGTYILTKQITLEANEELTVPKNKTLLIADGGSITVNGGSSIDNRGRIETRSTATQTYGVQKRESTVPKLNFAGGRTYTTSGSSIYLEHLEDISEGSGSSIICYPTIEIFVEGRKYVGNDDTALVRFSEEDVANENRNSVIGFGRNGDGEVSLFITKEAIISEHAQNGEVNCNFILKGSEIGEEGGKLTIPSVDVINLQTGGIHAESGSTLIIGGKTYFAPEGVTDSVFTVTKGAEYNNSKGLTIFSRGYEGGIMFWLCGEITMNETLPEENVFCMTRGAWVDGKDTLMRGTLTLNLTSDAEELQVAKGFNVKKENYHSTYEKDEENWTRWKLKEQK